MDFLQFLFVPTILFLTVLGPFWVIMHYTTKRREAKTLLSEESEALETLLMAADKMEKRIDSLEKILDADDVNWKDKTQ
ncbi:MAG: envelope stress response membrane protein PspB [Rhodospirillaceae bacterium]|jgi:phage shock protein B|nr:envelope stress response membrane protein PspB [Rhodospirillaceae bacterium]MBT5566227.1 envelope stress response membrane protein PspB [Rhodospirillaceae bacterium]MBT6088945.1 envelope stress response membrane protein PspB [Rhodospirillaceae bacterium]MBT6962429.1 envelope stress response membrane protein PspB [Rhodospirillaceae bacterium]